MYDRHCSTLHRISISLLHCGLCSLFFAGLPVTAEDVVQPDSFETTIAPLLIQRCIECHNNQETSGGLNLTTAQGLLTGGDSGPSLIAGNPTQSNLLQRVLDREMPPEKKGQLQALPDKEIKLLREWIAGGASWPKDRSLDLFEKTTSVHAGRDWWSLQPVKRPKTPQVNRVDWVNNPIDAFILARLEKNNYEPAPVAEKLVLIRRLYFDVIGLPPSKEVIDAFLADQSSDAYEKRVDKLLASPQFGERWARYWLDLVRF
ncbi:MAG: DUF1549 domain-containing protein, partial [Planctomycetaceae bacterium]|nr:DUF1549 domain-containing protein [Planctomycetaceae bacterium]